MWISHYSALQKYSDPLSMKNNNMAVVFLQI